MHFEFEDWLLWTVLFLLVEGLWFEYEEEYGREDVAEVEEWCDLIDGTFLLFDSGIGLNDSRASHRSSRNSKNSSKVGHSAFTEVRNHNCFESLSIFESIM